MSPALATQSPRHWLSVKGSSLQCPENSSPATRYITGSGDSAQVAPGNSLVSRIAVATSGKMCSKPTAVTANAIRKTPPICGERCRSSIRSRRSHPLRCSVAVIAKLIAVAVGPHVPKDLVDQPISRAFCAGTSLALRRTIPPILVLATLLAVSLGNSLQAQRPTEGKLRPLLPVVPNLVPRPSEGPGSPQRTERVGGERAAVSEFLDSVQGNDAAIHVIVGQGKLLTTKAPIAREGGVAVVAVGEPTILDFEVLPDPRMLRLIGRRIGVTDLMVVTSDGQSYGFEVHVGYDLELLRAHLKQIYPDALIQLGQIREHLVVEGQARSDGQVQRILDTIRFYLASLQSFIHCFFKATYCWFSLPGQ